MKVQFVFMSAQMDHELRQATGSRVWVGTRRGHDSIYEKHSATSTTVGRSVALSTFDNSRDRWSKKERGAAFTSSDRWSKRERGAASTSRRKITV